MKPAKRTLITLCALAALASGSATRQAEGADLEAASVAALKAAAEKGDVQAQFGLARRYHEGWGVPQDDVEAYVWMKLAAHQNPKFSSAFNQVADKLSLDDLLKVDALYRERRQTIRKRQEAATAQDGKLSDDLVSP